MWSALRRHLASGIVALSMGVVPTMLSAQVTVTPVGASSASAVKGTAENAATFRVTGQGPVLLECWGTGRIKCAVESEIDLSGPTNVEVLFDTPGAEGTGYVFLRVTQYIPARCDPESSRCDKHADVASRMYTIVSPPEPRPARD
jgi:hypothetical protein